MARVLLIAIFCLAAASAAKSQTQQELTLNDFYKEYRASQLSKGTYERNDAVAGTPYDQPEFTDGKIVTTSNQVYTGVPLRYNVYADEMEFTAEDGVVMAMAHPEIIRSIEIGDTAYIYAPYAAGNRILRGFFRIHEAGQVALLVKPKIVLRQAEPAQPYKEAQPPTYLKMGDEYFLKTGQGAATKVGGKKEVMQIMKDKSPEIENWLKRNKIKFNREEDLKQLVAYYNSLN